MSAVGVAGFKLRFREVLSGLLPLAQRFDPNAISWSIVPVGAATAGCYAAGTHAHWWFLVALPLIALRMVLATLDGYVAETTSRLSPRGAILNRVPAELADVALLLTLALTGHDRQLPGLLALAAAWLTTFSGLVGLDAGGPARSDGPAGQTDRLLALIAASVAAVVVPSHDPLRWYLWWVAAGGAMTVAIRLRAVLRSAHRTA